MKRLAILLITVLTLVSCGDEVEFNSPGFQGNREYGLWKAEFTNASIDENGYLKVTETNYQYYNVASVENGVIGTIQNDQGVESVANNGFNQVDKWFFTTKAAAETFLNSL